MVFFTQPEAVGQFATLKVAQGHFVLMHLDVAVSHEQSTAVQDVDVVKSPHVAPTFTQVLAVQLQPCKSSQLVWTVARLQLEVHALRHLFLGSQSQPATALQEASSV